MMKRVIYSSFILIGSLIIFGGTASYAQNMKEIRLNNISKDKDNSNSAYEGIVMFFKIDTAQSKTADGLKFSISLANDSNKDFLIRNPLNYLQIILINEAGHNVGIPQAPKAFIDAKRNTYGYESFGIDKIAQNKKIINEEFASKEEIRIAAKSNLEFFLKIENIISVVNGKSSTYLGQKMKIPIGKYKLGITLSLTGKEIKSQLFQISPISVNYN